MVQLPDVVALPGVLRLRVERLGIRRRRRGWLIRDLEWEHGPGTVGWVVGENGSGKSSLLRVLAGLARPAAGRVLRTGGRGDANDRLYYAPEMRLPGRATVADWARLSDALLCATGGAVYEGRLGAGHAKPEHPLGRLSTGEAKRLLLDTLLRRPASFIFLDEPYEHLSPEAKSDLTAILLDRAEQSVIVVATNQGVPREAADGPVLRLDGARPTAASAVEVAR